MARPGDPPREGVQEGRPAGPEAAPPTAATGRPAPHATPTTEPPPGSPPEAAPPAHPWRRWVLLALLVVGLGVGAYFLVPWVLTALNTVSTDDAYVNGHVTFVAPRVGGQVTAVLVDDNYRVKRGDLLVQLDKEPYQVQVAIKTAAVDVAKTNLEAAQAQVRAQVAQARANRYKLEHAIEDVNSQISNLRGQVAALAI